MVKPYLTPYRHTSSLKVYISDWNKFLGALEKKTNTRAFGFDTNKVKLTSKNDGNLYAEIPLWLAKNITGD